MIEANALIADTGDQMAMERWPDKTSDSTYCKASPILLTKYWKPLVTETVYLVIRS